MKYVVVIETDRSSNDLHEGLCKILHEGWSINDGIDGEHPLQSGDIEDVKVFGPIEE